MHATEITPPVLEFRNATIVSAGAGFVPLRRVDLQIAPRKVALVRSERGASLLPLAAAASGLLDCDSGDVLFESRLWRDTGPTEAARRRGRIGWVFAQWGWISNLTVLENVTLAQRHHRRRAASDVEQEANRLARRVGLDQVPTGRPAFVAPRDLRRAQWVRALVGRPALVLLEHPVAEDVLPYLDGLWSVVADAQSSGTAILWITSLDQVWNHAAAVAAERYTIEGRRLRPHTA